VSFQLFGEQADRGDYAIATGVYGTGAALLLLTPLIGHLFRLSVLPGLLGLLGAALLGALSISSADHLAGAAPSGYGDDSWTGGIAELASVPWIWALPALLLVGVVIRLQLPDTGRSGTSAGARRS
jgi:hypothetical protein